jgi:predicted NACHT family NTPase
LRLYKSVSSSPCADNNELSLAAYYVALSGDIRTPGGPHQTGDLLAHLSNWSGQKTGSQRIALLGENGSGKTSLCRMLAAKLAEQYSRNPEKHRLPILINLREYTKSVGIEALITSFLDQECGVHNPRYRLFDAMHRAGLFLIILDGFDEMASRTDADTIELNLSEIEKLANCPEAKLIVTTRPEYFTTEAEQESALQPGRDRTLLKSRSVNYEEIEISPWSNEQIEQFLIKRIGLLPEAPHSWEYYRDKIHEINDRKDLSRRPILAEMIVKTLPQLIASAGKIDRLNLYNTYLLSELRRQR